MPATRPTTIQQRQEIMQLAQAGLSHQAIAQDVGVSVWTARKWARQTRSGDLAALVSHVGRPITGSLADSPPLVRYVALRLKRQHPTWGAAYIVQKMQAQRNCSASSFFTARDRKDRKRTTVSRCSRQLEKLNHPLLLGLDCQIQAT